MPSRSALPACPPHSRSDRATCAKPPVGPPSIEGPLGASPAHPLRFDFPPHPDNGLQVRFSGLAAVVLGLACFVAPPAASAADEEARDGEDDGFIDPRVRSLPRKHRFRLGLQLDYMRMSAAVDEETGEVQRFHLVPLQLDFAYQARIARYLMVRPSLAIGGNPGNTLEAMPMIIHPQLFAGFQGRLVGVALGYGFLGAPVQNKDAVSEIRGGLGQPILSNAHHIGGELSFTTRIHQKRDSAPGAGELSILVRISGINGRTQHFDINSRRWRALFTFGLGWYFGDGKRARARRAQEAGEAEAF